MRVLGPTGKWVDIFTGLSPSLRKFPHNETEAYCVNPILLLVNGVALFYSGKYFGLPEKNRPFAGKIAREALSL